MKELFDFVEEETLLEYRGRLLGILVDRTPKCHPEIVGEGIEYSWGCSKGAYHRVPFTEKKMKEKFCPSVQKCLDPSAVLTIVRQRKLSKRARQYMLAYHSIDKMTKNTRSKTSSEPTEDVDEKKKPQMSGYLVGAIIKKFKQKTYKTHRSAEDCDAGYINAIVKEMKLDSSGDTLSVLSSS